MANYNYRISISANEPDAAEMLLYKEMFGFGAAYFSPLGIYEYETDSLKTGLEAVALLKNVEGIEFIELSSRISDLENNNVYHRVASYYSPAHLRAIQALNKAKKAYRNNG